MIVSFILLLFFYYSLIIIAIIIVFIVIRFINPKLVGMAYMSVPCLMWIYFINCHQEVNY